jgi:hypothetical protein
VCLGASARQKKRGLMPPQIARCGQRPLASQTVMNDDMRFKPRDQSETIGTNINSLFEIDICVGSITTCSCSTTWLLLKIASK